MSYNHSALCFSEARLAIYIVNTTSADCVLEVILLSGSIINSVLTL